ncbi:hypothetical protein [Halomonas salipaludis]|nr:hypothetical protein [Halomonas salipaludis]
MARSLHATERTQASHPVELQLESQDAPSTQLIRKTRFLGPATLLEE